MLVLFFNRPEALSVVLRRVMDARPRAVYLACDGPRECAPADAANVERCRHIASAAGWECPVHTRFLERNAGCARAVSGAVSWFFEHEPAGIVIEDDCLPSAEFFPFASELLDRYRDDERVMSISGTNFVPPRHTGAGRHSYRFSRAAMVWGWAGWARAWGRFRLAVDERDVRSLARSDLPVRSAASLRGWRKRLRSCIGEVPHAWGYQWSYAHFRHHGLAIVPSRNLVTNVLSDSGAHMTSDSPWQGLPAERLEFPLVHPEEVVPDARADRFFERVHCNHRPWLARKAWQLARRHGLVTPEEIRAGFDPARFLERLHAAFAAAWLCAMGISPAAESILFGCLCAVTAVRAPAIARRGLEGIAVLPLALWAAFVAWMAISVAWSGTSLPAWEAIPGRWFLGALLVLPSRLSCTSVLLATALPGAWWTVIMGLVAAGAPLPGWMAPGTPSVPALGIEMLAVAGIAAAVAGPGRRSRMFGWACVIGALGGAVLATSRALTAATSATACLMAAVTARGGAQALRRLAVPLALMAILAAAGSRLAIGDKMSRTIDGVRAMEDRIQSGAASPVDIVNRLASGRGTMYAWTANRVLDAWLAGHGASSWTEGFADHVIGMDGAAPHDSQLETLLGGRLFAHQIYLHVAYEYGAVGLALMSAFAAACWSRAWPARRSMAAAAVLALVAMHAVLGVSQLAPNSQTTAVVGVVLLALTGRIEGRGAPPDRRTPRDALFAASVAVAFTAITLIACLTVRTLQPVEVGVVAMARDERFRPNGNLLPDSTLFPGGPWVPVASGKGVAPRIEGQRVHFDAGEGGTGEGASFLELPTPALAAGEISTFSFSVRGPEGSFLAARGAAGVGMSRIPLNGRWQRVHLTEVTAARGTARLRIGLASTNAGEFPLPAAVAVELKNPQLVLGRGSMAYEPTEGPGAPLDPVRRTVVADEACQLSNLLRWSRRFDREPWRATGLSLMTLPAERSPAGSMTAMDLVEDALVGTHGIRQDFRCTSAGEWTASVYVAPRARQACRLAIELPGGQFSASFDLAAGTVVSVAPENGGTARLERIDDRWFRLELRGHAASEGEASISLLTLDTPDGDGQHAGTERPALLVWGAQVERGPGSGIHVPTAFWPRTVDEGAEAR